MCLRALQFVATDRCFTDHCFIAGLEVLMSNPPRRVWWVADGGGVRVARAARVGMLGCQWAAAEQDYKGAGR